jgi:hypothetical protein
MRTIIRRPSHTVTERPTRRGAASNGHSLSSRVRAQLVSDAVIAGYIHDISVRHRPETREAPGRETEQSDAGR